MRIEREIASVLIACLLLPASCAHFRRGDSNENFVWVEDLEESQRDSAAFRLQPGDVIRVDVWKQGDLSGNLRVRSDGNVTVPLVGDVRISGLMPAEASDAIAVALEGVVRNPTVVVGVVEVRPIKVGVLGEVESPGMYELERGSGVLHALALAGGLTEFADRKRIFVIRNGASDEGENDAVPIRFDYETLVKSSGAAVQFRLGAGDIVMVE